MLLVTGGCGFIGAHLIDHWLERHDEPLLNLDALTYAARPESLARWRDDPRYRFVHGDVADRALLDRLLDEHRPRAVLHLAAQSHVDRAIRDATPFFATNVMGTLCLWQAWLAWRDRLPAAEARALRAVQVSTDEVYGALAPGDPPADEEAPFAPRNPYAASKAAGDHLAMSLHVTAGLAVSITHGSNTYGARQFPEKLIPVAVARLARGEPVPLYGDGLQVRDWIHVDDHVAAILRVLEAGEPGRRYNVADAHPLANRDLVARLAAHVDALTGRPRAGPDWVSVADRPGHDRRYAIDSRRLRDELGWAPRVDFEAGLRDTVAALLAEAA